MATETQDKQLTEKESNILLACADKVDEVGRQYESRLGTDGVSKRTLTMLAVLSLNLHRLATNE